MGFLLKQCYPNPFNPTTTIEFQIPIQCFVKLSILNTLGQEVDILVNNNIEPGIHQVKYDASKLSSGVYFYRMQTDTYVETRKFVLMK